MKIKIFLFTLIALLTFSSVAFSDSVTKGQKDYEFGKYNNETLKWRVLEVDEDNNRALLVTEKAVKIMAYQSNLSINPANSWLKSEVRTWLNGDFLDGLGNDKEKIIKVRLQDETYDETYTNLNYHKSSEVEWNASGDDADSVFLLSVADADNYFADDDDRVCYLLSNSNTNPCFWWLRSPGFRDIDVAYVIAIGEVGYSGWDVNDNKYIAVRPAVWINLSSVETQKNNNSSGSGGGCTLSRNFFMLGFLMLIFKIKKSLQEQA